ncbi:putative Ig domain-containing protein [Massilia sp. W12]|uniref:putative Ig domain-containing protein n=1 Tax=Massilia sp. W12 TaxID=3126507 RepID=UPI0030D18BA0
MNRAYVFGSSEFEINPEAKFIINPDGSREINDIAVIPVNDNFDFSSDALPARITNFMTESRIDPSKIGRTVPIIFTGKVKSTDVLTGEDWYAMELSNSLDKLGLWASYSLTPAAIMEFGILMMQVTASGIIDYKTPEDRFVYYDGESPSNNGDLSAANGLPKVQGRGTLYDGSVALIGGGGNDTLSGDILSDELFGGAGNDSLDGGLSGDTLQGGDGNDTLLGSFGADKLQGENDNDSIDGGSGDDTLGGGAGDDIMSGGIDNDQMQGDAGNDSMEGGTGDDKLAGGLDNDTLIGGMGNDVLEGGAGNDWLDGGFGANQLAGDTGFDTYLSGDGDVLQDSDGAGTVQLGGVTLRGGKREEGKSYYYDKGFDTYYLWSGSTLKVVRGSSAITIKGWGNGQLGITLKEDNPKPPPLTSPIVLDLDNDGLETVGIEAGAHFDHSGDGFAEASGWVKSDDGLLALDLNEDGRINSGKELFGSETMLKNGAKAEHGFTALAELDSNLSKQIDAQDAAFAKLRVWRDLNQNGVSDEGELFTLQEAGVHSVDLAFTNSNVVDQYGNQHRQRGSFAAIDGGARSAADIWFVTDPADTFSTVEAASLSLEVQALPNLEGYGQLPSLHQAMQRDPVLKTLVREFVQTTSDVIRNDRMRDILWRWTGADQQSPSSRGSFINDARWLYMVEALQGKQFIQYAGTNAGTPNPGPMAAENINQISKRIYEVFYARLAAETFLKPMFDGLQATWNPVWKIFDLDASASTAFLRQALLENPGNGLQLVKNSVRALRAFEQLDSAVYGALINGLQDILPEISQILQANNTTGYGLDPWYLVNVTLIGLVGDDTLVGGNSDDTLTGLAGNDSLVGNSGHDIINGGAGNDTLYGNAGSDQYLFARGHGQDTVDNYDRDSGHYPDSIVYDASVTPADVDVVRSGNDLQLIIRDSADRITVSNFFQLGDEFAQIDSVQFADRTVWDADHLISRSYVITDGADQILGSRRDDTFKLKGGNDTAQGSAGNDVLEGEGGDDVVSGGEGNDTMIGGAGHDYLDGGAGDDSYQFGLNDGHDVIREGGLIKTSDAGGNDTLFIKGPIDPAQVKIARDRTDIILSLPGKNVGQEYVYDSIRLQNALDNGGDNAYIIERVVFDNGVEWSFADLKARLISSSDSNDLLEGYATPDQLAGNGGNDTLIGHAGADVLQGNAGEDQLSGGAGDDQLDGGAGNDMLSGGAGNNFYILDQGGGQDVVTRNLEDWLEAKDTVLIPAAIGLENIEMRREGVDVIFQIKGSSDSIRFKGVMINDGLFRNYRFQYGIAGGATVDLEQVRQALLHGGASSDMLTGYATNDNMTGGLGNDTLDGAGGIDTLSGGAGNDEYVVDNLEDQILEAADEGHELVRARSNYTLPQHIEDLQLEEDAYSANIKGNSMDNLLRGNSSGNTLEGAGGQDTLDGGAGDDTYVLNSGQETIIEAEEQGRDTVVAPDSYVLRIETLENLTLAGEGNSNATGNAQNNTLQGNRGNNILDGLTGADNMRGGAGDDIYFSDNEEDRISESSDEGIDTIVRSFDTLLVLNDNVENLTLAGDVQHGNGNELDNLITGNDADNSLLGLGGNDTLIGGLGKDSMFGREGADSMVGGAGDDYYEIDDAGDVIVELANEGYEMVRSTVSWTLGDNLERLALDGEEHLNANGNALNNGLWGNAGNNMLAGGLGNDYMEGGLGDDVYLFNKGDGKETIDNTDLSSAVDILRFGAGISENDVSARRQDNNLFILLKGGTDQVAFLNYFGATEDIDGQAADQKIDRIEFANGAVWDQSMIQTVVDRALNNHPPTVTNYPPALTARAGTAFTYVVPQNTVTDPDSWDSVSYSAKMSDGSALPAWLQFDAASRTFSGTPGTADVGVLQFVLWGTDNYGYSAGAGVRLTVGAPNNAPVLSTPLADQTANVGALFSFAAPSKTFTDPDAGDSLSYSATQADGSPLPAWLNFNPATRTFSGTPSAIGNVSVKLTAKDTGNLSVSDVFEIAVKLQNLNLQGTSGSDTLQGGAGNDTISGLAGNDSLLGFAGNDVLDGGAGNDSLLGGAGDDLYIVDSSQDAIGENANEGVDTVQASASFALSANLENLSLSGSNAINGAGNALNNQISGNSAANFIDGGAGNDSMAGGLGNDVYVVDSAQDQITENAGEGTDQVQSSISLTLGANLENLFLTGSNPINGAGNALNNQLSGNSAANLLDGGLGNDTMAGGAGNDTYVVDSSLDGIIENASEGTDLVQASVSYTLPANLENLSLSGSNAINGTGNSLHNQISGNSAANLLDGGAGNDSMAGGAGNDSYVVDNAMDVITENLDEGTDLVQAGITYTLGANLENLTLSGSSAINGTGNAQNNLLIGNSAINSLNGAAGNDTLDGGAGADKLAGGAGNDVYLLDNTGDVVTENSAEGIDQVRTALTHTLAANVEALWLSGSNAVNGTGNTLNNLLWGNGAVNTLNGAAGHDILQGFAGNDILSDNAGNNLFDGGAGNDSITGGSGNELLLGGSGNDTINTGSGADVILFNQGDGQDTIAASSGKDNTVSLGKGIKYADLLFKKSSNDLILVTGATEQITFKDWYASSTNRSVANLQVVIEGTSDYNSSSTNKLNNKKVQQFNFDGLVAAFDQARSANPSLSSWALSTALLAQHVAGNDGAALGGDLAYQYAGSGNLAALSMTPAHTLLSNSQFGLSAQALQASANLQDSSPRLG